MAVFTCCARRRYVHHCTTDAQNHNQYCMKDAHYYTWLLVPVERDIRTSIIVRRMHKIITIKV
jgi:hypothetical protein